MKKYLVLGLMGLSVFMNTGCTSFLDEESYGSTTEIFNDESGLKALVNLSYTKMYNL